MTAEAQTRAGVIRQEIVTWNHVKEELHPLCAMYVPHNKQLANLAGRITDEEAKPIVELIRRYIDGRTERLTKELLEAVRPS